MSTLLSALMVTQPGREDFEAQATADFMAQTYLPRELIVVRDPKDGTTLGELRNRTVEEARGELIAIWDDDDRYEPHRLEMQVNALGDADMTFLERLTLECTCGETVPSRRRKWECSMVARRASMLTYPWARVGEDYELVKKMFEAGRICTMLDRPQLYCKRAHANNTIGHEAILLNAGHRC